MSAISFFDCGFLSKVYGLPGAWRELSRGFNYQIDTTQQLLMTKTTCDVQLFVKGIMVVFLFPFMGLGRSWR